MSARRKNSLTRRVRRAYRQDELAGICTLPEDEFGMVFGMQTVEVAQRAPHDYYHFRDNGASVLAVAHLDTVAYGKDRKPSFYATQSGPAIISGALDDRLGAYVILRLLPEAGLTCDWLLTVGEERGQSTAEFFQPQKNYDHVIEFDRGGTDVVLYQYEDKASTQAVEASGAVTGIGSFSDISYMEHLKVKAFNWGVGYRGDYHSKDGYACLNDTFAMTAKYLRFHAQNAGTAMPHEPEDYFYGSGGRYSQSSRYFDCRYCGAYEGVDPDTLFCDFCDACMDCGQDANGCLCYTDPPRGNKPVKTTADIALYSGECRHDNYTTCGCNNGLQKESTVASTLYL